MPETPEVISTENVDLLDYFAANAMAALIAKAVDSPLDLANGNVKSSAALSYAIANQMLNARKEFHAAKADLARKIAALREWDGLARKIAALREWDGK